MNLSSNTRALFLVIYGSNSSGGWDTTLSILYFDEEGNPFPWEMYSGYVDATPDGLANVVRLKDTNSVGVIAAEREMAGCNCIGLRRDEFRLYKLSSDGVQEIKGSELGVRWPFVYEGEKGHRGEHSPQHDLSMQFPAGNKMSSRVGEDRQVHKVVGVRDEKDSGPVIVMSNIEVPFPEVLVVDGANERSIVSGPRMEDVSELKIAHGSAQIFGNNCGENTCYPVVVWIKSDLLKTN